jgi:hypothetical protein
MPLYTGAAKAIAPAYNTLVGASFQQIPRALYPGTSAYLFGTRKTAQLPPASDNVSFETPGAGQASIPVDMGSQGGANVSIVPNVGLELIFNANPGAFNIQVQEADTDADGCFITPAPAAFTITAATQVGAFWVARVDLGTIGSGLVRLLCSANPNAVGILAKLTMQ